MLTPRRTAQLGILSATVVFFISVGVLIMQGAGSSVQQAGSASVNPSPAQTPSMPLELSVSSAPHPATTGGQR
jgi:hypothetical protein